MPPNARAQVAHLIRQIPSFYNKGKSYREIADWLYESGLRGNNGCRVSHEEVRKIMFNDFYLGEFTYRDIRYNGKHKPLFSWIDIQKARNRSEEKGLYHSTKDKKDKFLFKKLSFFCITDKTRITAELKKKYYKRTHREVIYELYHCTKSKGGWQHCKQPCINKDSLILEFAKKAVAPIDLDKELAEFMFEEMVQNYENNQENQEKLLHNINIRLGQLESELRNLFEMRITGKIESFEGKTPEQIYEEYRLKKQIEIKKLLKAKKNIEEQNKDWKKRASNFFSLCLDATNRFLAAFEDKQYLFLRKVTSNVFLDEKQLVVTHQFPFSGLLKTEGREFQYPMWDATRTYITSEIDPQEKNSHLIILQRFKLKDERK